jgi:hypothetical protein
MLKYIGLAAIFSGMGNLDSDRSFGWLCILAGICLVGYGIARKNGLMVAYLILPLVSGYMFAGWAGVVAGGCVTVLLAAGIAQAEKKALAVKGYSLLPDWRMTSRLPIGGLYARMRLIYPYVEPVRGQYESPQAFEDRQHWSKWRQGTDAYEIEVVPGTVRRADNTQFKAEVHRIVLYREPNRFRAVRPKEVCEVKIKSIVDASPLEEFFATATCVDNEGFPVSLQKGTSYKMYIGSLRLGDLNFLRIIDESGEPYFYPQQIFTDVRRSAVGEARLQPLAT